MARSVNPPSPLLTPRTDSCRPPDSDQPKHIFVPAVSAYVPPPTAFAPALTILKRPTPTPSTSSRLDQSNPLNKEKTLKERERDYQLAKSRIFGHSTTSEPILSASKSTPHLTTTLSNLSLDTTPHPARRQRTRPPKSATETRESATGTRESSPSSTPPLSQAIRKPRGPPPDGRGGFGGTGGNTNRGGRTKGGEGAAQGA